MSDVEALGEFTAVQLKFQYDVHADFITEQIKLSGTRPPERWEITIDLAEEVQDPDDRLRLLRAWEVYSAVPGYPVLPEPTSEPSEFLHHVEYWVHMLEGDVDEAASAFEAEMDFWIESNGSPRLRKARGRHYKVNRLYALERGAIELAGSWIDTNESADLRERTDPSEEALNLEDHVVSQMASRGISGTTRIMWVAEGPRGAQEAAAEGRIEYFGDEEAVVVLDYLARYRAIIAVDPACRNPDAGAAL